MNVNLAPWIVITGLDGAGKTTLVERLAAQYGAFTFRLPHHAFVKDGLRRSGGGKPFGDVYTDRLILATDARLVNYLLRDWRSEHRLLISQRAWMDNFIFGAVQGWSYGETDSLLRTAELERPTAIVYLTADPPVAYERIRNDSGADKFETLDFIRVQYAETAQFYRAVAERHPRLEPLLDVPATWIDTTSKSHEETQQMAVEFLRHHVAEVRIGGTHQPPR